MAHGSGGGNIFETMDFGKLIIIFLVILFFMWLLTGGQNKESAKKPFVRPLNDSNSPGEVYGPEDVGSNWGSVN